MKLSFIVNGRKRICRIEGDETLLEVLRDTLGLKGTKNGCETGDCGACAVIVDGMLVNSCLMLAIQARGSNVTTIEGIGSPKRPDQIQTAFVEEGAIQCGYCTPAMILAAKTLLDNHPQPTEDEIKRQMCGILCRCTGYNSITRAIRTAAKRRAQR
jgi:carbon-monoxide dehydrogenase small subunit